MAGTQPTAKSKPGARFELIPAIDLLDGKVVNLVQGDYGRATVFGDDPAQVAARFAAHRPLRIHVVDLDGARAGAPANAAALRAIVAAAAGIPVQVGGGVREASHVEARFEAGVERVILGTAALRDPALVRAAAERHPGRIAVGIDAREGRVAVSGWLETSETTALELARCFEDAGVAALIHTDIGRDGTFAGPNLEASAELAASVSIPVIASGGVGSEADVERAAGFARRGVAGLIVGRALYTGAVDLARALEIARCC